MEKILKLLENDATLTPTQLAAMLSLTEEEVSASIEQAQQAGILLGHKALIDWEKTDTEVVTAMIDVKVTPQRGEGFDRVAGRIYQYEEVESLYLMSGGHDLSVLITGRTMKEVALFVAQKLSPMEGVTGTATHFILKKYKDRGVVFETPEPQEERIQMV